MIDTGKPSVTAQIVTLVEDSIQVHIGREIDRRVTERLALLAKALTA